MVSPALSPSITSLNRDNLQGVKEKIKHGYIAFIQADIFANTNHSSLRSNSCIASVAFGLPGLGDNRFPFFSWSKAMSNLAPASHAKNNLFELASSHFRMESCVFTMRPETTSNVAKTARPR
jgi:hypothetical protein